jgi:hypothetical protein
VRESGGVFGAADEAFVAGPGGGVCAAVAAEGQGALAVDGLFAVVGDGGCGGAVPVVDQPGEASGAADGDGVAAGGVVARRRGGTVVRFAEFGAVLQVEGGAGGVAAPVLARRPSSFQVSACEFVPAPLVGQPFPLVVAGRQMVLPVLSYA